MADRDGYPAGVPCWVDSGRVSAQAAKDFYGGLFGWEFENRSPEGFPPYFGAQLGGRDVAAIGEQAEQLDPPVWNTYVWVENADATAAKAVAAGGKVEMAPVDAGQAGRFAALSDPTGAGFCVWQANQHRGAVAVNEPGAWVSSELNTPDVDTAMAFYGTLFGWEADDPSEEGHATIRKPGYGDYLEELTPGLRKMHADVGAPKDFADVVGWLTADHRLDPRALERHLLGRRCGRDRRQGRGARRRGREAGRRQRVVTGRSPRRPRRRGVHDRSVHAAGVSGSCSRSQARTWSSTSPSRSTARPAGSSRTSARSTSSRTRSTRT